MIIVEEYYLTKCLDSGVYQSLLVVGIGNERFEYTHTTRLWSEKYIDELRENEKYRARNTIMNSIRSKLFPE